MKNKMPSITNFASVYRHKATDVDKEITYTIKPKLHGTNGSIQITDEGIEYRSKNRVLSPTSDHADFTKTMMAFEDAFQTYRDFEWNGKPITIYGEWAGPGIQKTDAVSKIPQRTFFAFAVHIHGGEVHTDNLMIDNYNYFANRIMEIPVYHRVKLNFNMFKPVDDFVKLINDEVARFEVQDPFIMEKFGIEGCGEGVVGSPLLAPSFTAWSEYTFKAKTEAHRVKATKAPATVREPLPQEAFEFASTYVTLPRIQQAMSELDIDEPTMKNTSDIIKWMNTDIIKESMEDLQDMGLDYSKVQKVVNTRIVNMWKEVVNRLEIQI